MYHGILVGVDGSMAGRQALEVALEMAKANGATVTVLSVEEKLPAYAATVGEVEETRRQKERYFYRLQQAALVRAKQMGVPLQAVILAGNAGQTLARYADQGGFDLIVVGATGHELGAGHIGSTADRVVEMAPCSVLVVRKRTGDMKVRDAMSRHVRTVGPDTPISQVVQLLWREGVKAVPVVNGDRYVVGIITGGDLLARGDLDLRLSLQRAMEPAEIAAQLHKLEQSGKNAADVMTHPVVSVGENVSLADAARVMATQHIKRLPVVDEQERLQGILSRIDLLREIASMGQLAEPSAEAPTVPARLVRDVMIRDMPTVTESAALDEVIAALGESPFRRVAVVDDLGRVVGLISDREMLERVEPHARPTLIAALMQRFRGGMVEAKVEPQIRKGSADEVMISPVVVVTDDTPIVEAIRLTVEREIKRLPVVDGVGHLVGMVDRQSLLRAMVLAESEATPQHVGPTIQ